MANALEQPSSPASPPPRHVIVAQQIPLVLATLDDSMPGPWMDAHCHLADDRFAADFDAVIERSLSAGVRGWIQGGVCPADWRRQADLRRHVGAGLRLAYGLHPWWVSVVGDRDLDGGLLELESLAEEAELVGELGLDFHATRLLQAGSRERQQRAFESQLELARRLDKPVVLHIVRAHETALTILERHGPFPAGGLVHAFAGSREQGRRYIELGLLLSIAGSAIGRDKLFRALEALPISSIVVETDAPDQPPRGWSLARGEPAQLPRIATELATIWAISGQRLLDTSTASLQAMLES